jgi:hypothetical protein
VFRLIGETLVVWGGLEADGWTHTGATFDIASGSWRPMSLTGAPPAMLKVKAAAWTGPYLTVLGTHRETRAPLGRRYHVAQDRWAPVALEGIPSWAPGGESIAIGAGERVIILDVRPQQPSQGAVYHATEDRWSSLQAPRSLYPANRLRVASAGSRLFFLMPSLHWAAFLNPTTMAWEEVSLARSGLPDRSEASYHWTGERLLVWGGVQRRVVDAGGGCENHDPSEGGCDPVPPTYATEVYTKGRIFRPDPTPH